MFNTLLLKDTPVPASLDLTLKAYVVEGLKPGIVHSLDKPKVATIVPFLYTLYPTVSPPDANSGHVILAVVLVTVLAEITGGINPLRS